MLWVREEKTLKQEEEVEACEQEEEAKKFKEMYARLQKSNEKRMRQSKQNDKATFDGDSCSTRSSGN